MGTRTRASSFGIFVPSACLYVCGKIVTDPLHRHFPLAAPMHLHCPFSGGLSFVSPYPDFQTHHHSRLSSPDIPGARTHPLILFHQRKFNSLDTSAQPVPRHLVACSPEESGRLTYCKRTVHRIGQRDSHTSRRPLRIPFFCQHLLFVGRGGYCSGRETHGLHLHASFSFAVVSILSLD